MVSKYDDKEGENLAKEEDPASAMAPNLLPEVIEEILSRLPVKPLIRFRCVSKPWCNLLSINSSFIKKQLNTTLESSETHGFIMQTKSNNFFSIPNGSVENTQKLESSCIERFRGIHIVGSSNGLICLSSANYSRYSSTTWIWNPSTRQYKKLPFRGIFKQPFGEQVGFGFDPRLDDYKVVRIVNFHYLQQGKRRFHMEVEIYSLNTNSWRGIGVFPYCVLPISSRQIMNGAIHWVAYHGDYFGNHDYAFILSFGITDETFREVPMPAHFKFKNISDLHLGVLRGCLALIVSTEGTDIDILVMKDYGVRESWTKLFTIENQTQTKYSVALLKNDEVLLDMIGSGLCCYNLIRGDFNNIRIPQLHELSLMVALPYVESLVQLKATHDCL